MSELTSFCFLDTEEICKELAVNPQVGLSWFESRQRVERHGRNILPTKPRKSIKAMIYEQFEDSLVRILLFSAFISSLIIFFDGKSASFIDYVEPAIILLILIANAFVGIYQEISAEISLESLKDFQTEFTNALRSGSTDVIKVLASEISIGDIIYLHSGDKVPADLRILSISSSYLSVDESILTGESRNAYKIAEKLNATKDSLSNQEKLNLLFSGTHITAGSCIGIVIKVGIETEFGKISSSLTETESDKSPLKLLLDEFASFLSKVIMVICALVWLANIHRFADPHSGRTWISGAIYYFKIAISLAVAAIPEGLPAVITTCLALGTQEMARNNAIVRKLNSIQALGCMSVLCTDKTGTLTTNNMCVKNITCFKETGHHANKVPYELEFRSVNVTGFDYSPDGTIDFDASEDSACLLPIIENCILCNNSTLHFNEESSKFEITGNPTEACLLTLTEKYFKASNGDEYKFGEGRFDVRGQNKVEKIFEFTRERKMMSVMTSDGKIFTKGAPENVLQVCKFINNSQSNPDGNLLNDKTRQKIKSKLNELMACQNGFRCIALAHRSLIRKNFQNLTLSEVEQDLCLDAIIGIHDPPKESAKRAIEYLSKAGVQVTILTGDSCLTAQSIANQIGLFGSSDSRDCNKKQFVCDGNFLNSKDERFESDGWLSDIKLFARVEPLHKLKIVDSHQKIGNVVAMTGDGVNDAPALKKSDIGIAMGSGTSVAKSVSDMVILDDDLMTIVRAIKQGRAIYDNIQLFIRYLISSNIGEVVSIFLIALTGMPDVLIPVQLLWVNLVTDGLPATALGFNPPDCDIMERKPKKVNEPLITRATYFRYATVGIYVGFATIASALFYMMHFEQGPKLTFSQITHHHQCYAQTGSIPFKGVDCSFFERGKVNAIALSTLVLIEMLNALNSISEANSLLIMPPWRNKWLLLAILSSLGLHAAILYNPVLAKIFHVEPLSFSEWLLILKFSLPVIAIDEIFKFSMRVSNFTASAPFSAQNSERTFLLCFPIFLISMATFYLLF